MPISAEELGGSVLLKKLFGFAYFRLMLVRSTFPPLRITPTFRWLKSRRILNMAAGVHIHHAVMLSLCLSPCNLFGGELHMAFTESSRCCRLFHNGVIELIFERFCLALGAEEFCCANLLNESPGYLGYIIQCFVILIAHGLFLSYY